MSESALPFGAFLVFPLLNVRLYMASGLKTMVSPISEEKSVRDEN